MTELPADLLEALPEGTEPIARQWWSSLSEKDRRRVEGLWDKRVEVRFFSPQADEGGQVDDWDQVPRVEGGRFVPKDDTRGLNEWGPDYFDYLLEHPELVLAYEPTHRIFHICTQHSAARACLDAGKVPADFACPLGSAKCPMESLCGARLIRAGR